MAEIARESKRQKTKETRIDFRCKFRIGSGLPTELERGFEQLEESSRQIKAPKAGLTNHYKHAHRLLGALQGKPEVKLLCMLALTVGMATTTSSDMIVYNTPSAGSKDEIAAGFAIAADGKVKHKGEGTRAALLALRMLWFLRPDEFV
ncbi:hypothetical protein V8C42DRAFT_364385 [Trichoderma barbatum]